MARKTKSRSTAAGDGGEALRESAQKIWLAGLGALERARTEGPRLFETLVEQGRDMGARAVGAADEALKALREGRYTGADLKKLERLLEERVTGSLSKLGLMTQREVDALREEVRDLSDRMRRMSGVDMGAGASRGPRKAGARKATGAAKARARKATRKAAGTASRAGTKARKAAAGTAARTGATQRKAAARSRKRAAAS